MIANKKSTEELVRADRDLRDIDRRLDRLEYRLSRTWILLGIITVEVALTVKWEVMLEWLGIMF